MEKQTQKTKVDFLGLGFPKCGSSWIYTLLQEHPDVCMSYPKETSFFIFHDLEQKPSIIKHYQKFFPDHKKGNIKGEIDPKYAVTDRAFQNIKKFYPDSKFLIILRDPVEKKISEYIFERCFARKEPDPGKLIQKELNGTQGLPSLYIEYLKKWYNSFPSQNFYVMILEEVIGNPASEISNLYNFLGVDPKFTPPSLYKPVNTAKRFHYPFLQKMLSKTFNGFVKRHPLLFYITEKMYFWRLFKAVRKWNSKEYKKPTVSKETKDMLYKNYESEIKEIEEFLNRDLSIWKEKYE